VLGGSFDVTPITMTITTTHIHFTNPMERKDRGSTISISVDQQDAKYSRTHNFAEQSDHGDNSLQKRRADRHMLDTITGRVILITIKNRGIWFVQV